MTFEEWWEDAHKKHRLEPGLSLREIFAVCWADATAIEREACAKIAEQHEEGPGGAEAIRARYQTTRGPFPTPVGINR